jgi:predicted transposase YbfD/YdcC
MASPVVSLTCALQYYSTINTASRRIAGYVRKFIEQCEENISFISSLKFNALLYYDVIRLHWQIENSLHWVKDATPGENDSK